MKLLVLVKGEPAYLKVPEDCSIIVDPTSIKQKGQKLILVRAV